MNRSFFLFLLVLLPLVPRAQDTTQVVSPASAETSPQRADIDTLVVYSAKDSIIYSMRTRFMYLYGESNLQYRTMGLKADRVNVNWDTATLFAEGALNPADTSKQEVVGKPVLKDGGETYDGSIVRYNFRTKKGKITLGESEIEDGHYRGEHIKKIDTDVLFVSDGVYTTCNADHPHFFFYSPKMKIIVRDHIVAEPIYFFIADVPVFALPFGVFPNKSGRRSGLIPPTYGYDSRLGHFLSRFGYSWAVNDYMDVTSTFDWFTRGGWLNQSQLRYALRYNFTGFVNSRVTRTYQGAQSDRSRTERRDYNIQLGHNHQIDPTTRADVNFTFSSGTFYRNFSTNLDEILRQNIVSTATLSKTWEESNRNLTVSIYRDQSLTDGSVSERLPSVTFSQGQIFPFRKKGKSRGVGTALSGESAWYEQIGLNYSANAINERSKSALTIDSVRSATDPMVFSSIKDFRRTSAQTVSQSISTGISPKIGEFTISPSISFRDERAFGETETPIREARDSTLTSVTVRRKTVRGMLSSGVGASTRFYGVFQPRIFGITALRHAVTPNASLTYNKQVYGQNIPKYSLTGSINVGNNFEMKYQASDTSKEEKIQLLNAGTGLSYDFARDSLNFSEISTSYRTEIGRYLNFNANTSHNLYVFDRTTSRRINKFLLNEKGYPADLTSFSLSISTSLSGEKKTKAADEGVPQEVLEEQERTTELPLAPGQTHPYGNLYGDEAADFSIPWNLSLSYTFNQSQQDPRRKFRSSGLNASLSFNLTEGWRFSASGNYDFVRKEFAAPTVNISRDLHCWLMNFTWFPIGFYSGYRLEVRIKAPQLQDIKVTKQGSARPFYSN